MRHILPMVFLLMGVNVLSSKKIQFRSLSDKYIDLINCNLSSLILRIFKKLTVVNFYVFVIFSDYSQNQFTHNNEAIIKINL